MEFLGVGYQEILVILVLMLIVLGPERLPEMAFQIGKGVRKMQRYARAVRDEFSEEFQYLEEQYNTVRGDIDEARHDLEREQRELDRDVREVDRELQQASREVDQSVSGETRKDSRGNVVPISAAASQQQQKRPVRPGEKPSRPSPAERKAAAAKGKSSAATATRSPAKRDNKPSTDGEGKDKDSGPPLVF